MSEAKQILLSKVQTLKRRGIFLLVIEPILFILIFVGLFVSIIGLSVAEQSYVASIILLTISIISIFVFFILNLIFSILAIITISNTNWNDDNLNQEKQIYWILSLVFMILLPIVGFIIWIVWASKVKNTLENHTTDSSNNEIKSVEFSNL